MARQPWGEWLLGTLAVEMVLFYIFLWFIITTNIHIHTYVHKYIHTYMEKHIIYVFNMILYSKI